MADTLWEVYAARYAHHERAARENFIAGDPHDESPMPLDYFVWAVGPPTGHSSSTRVLVKRWLASAAAVLSKVRARD